TQWFDGYLTTSRRPDELLAEVRFPAARPGTGVSFEEVARRHGDFAIVGLAASLVLSGGVISDARLAFAGVSDVPVRATAAEDLLAGERPSAELFDEATRRPTCTGRRITGRRSRPRWCAAACEQQRTTPREAVTDGGHHPEGQRRDAHGFAGGAQDAGGLPAG